MSFEDKRRKQNSTVVYDIAQHSMFYLPLVGFLMTNEKIFSNAALIDGLWKNIWRLLFCILITQILAFHVNKPLNLGKQNHQNL